MSLRYDLYENGIVDGNERRYRNRDIKNFLNTEEGQNNRYLKQHTNINNVRKALNRVYEKGGTINTIVKTPEGEGLQTFNHPKYNHDEESYIYQYLIDQGVPHTQASAIMGNIAVESMLNPHISQVGGGGGGGYGLIQATDQPRKNNFINYDGQPYVFGSKLDPETQRQLDYIIDK